VEEHVHLGLAVAERADVLSDGNLVLVASAADLRDDMALVQASYLGDADLIPTTETERS
jgi:ABC-type branched-subunit amino acid transport system ATPase component